MSMDNLVEVLVEATGNVERVPAHWIGDLILGRGIEKTTRQRVLDGEIEPADVANPPTEHDTHAVIDEYAATAGIDLGEAKTKAEKVAVITEVLDAAPIPTAAEVDDADPSNPTDAGDTESSTETPATGGQE